MRYPSAAMAVCLVFVGFLVGWMPADALAQHSDREKRRRFVEGLLQTLVDSHLPPPGDPARPPVHAPPPTAAAAPPAPYDRVAVGREIEGFAGESRRLLQTLQGDWTHAGVVGPLVGETAKVHHAATALASRSRHGGQGEQIVDDYRSLNSDWRVLAHRIRETRDLSPACRTHVDTLDRHDRQLCRFLGIQAQMDRMALHRQTVALTVDLQNLSEDLEADLASSQQQGKLLGQCREVQQRAAEVTEATYGNAGHDVLQAAYREFRRAWSSLAASLRPIEIPYVQRSVRRIWQSDRLMHELLWMPYETDASHLVHMAQLLQGHIDRLYDTVSLEDLIDLPPTRQVLPTASEFYGLCEYFILCAEDKDSLDDLGRAYWDLDAAWPEFSACFASARSPDVQHTLREIEQSMTALRQLLGIPPAIDWELAQQRSARLEYLAHALERNLESTLRDAGGYSNHVRSRISAATTKSRAFCRACGELNGMIVAKAEPARLAQECGKVAGQWNGLLKDLNTVFREEDVRSSTGEIAKSLVDLQTAFGP